MKHLLMVAGAATLLGLAPPAWAQTTAATTAISQIKVAEGTEFPIRLEEAISSSSATEGDRFTISLDDDVKLTDGTVLRAGYRGVGEVVEARDNGLLGKNGKLNVRLLYLRVRRNAPRVATGCFRSPTGGLNQGLKSGSFC